MRNNHTSIDRKTLRQAMHELSGLEKLSRFAPMHDLVGHERLIDPAARGGGAT